MSKNVNNDVTMNPPIYLPFGWPEVVGATGREGIPPGVRPTRKKLD